jgi:hypothetical protein
MTHKISKTIDIVIPLTFLYFVTLHADQLQLRLGEVGVRLNNVIAWALAGLILSRYKKSVLFFDRSLLIALLGITFSFTLSFLFSSYKTRALLFIVWWVETACFYILLPYLLFQIISVKKIMNIYVCSFCTVGGYACIQLLLSFIGVLDPFASQFVLPGRIVRANAFCYEPSFYALYMTPFVIMATLHFLLKEKDPFFIFQPLKARHLIFINLLFLVSTATSVIFAYLSFALICALFSFSYLRSHLSSIVKFFLSCLAVIVTMCLSLPMLTREFFLKFFYQGFMTHHSFSERWMGIVNGWTLFKLHPFLGVGMGAYPLAIMDYYAREEGVLSYRYYDINQVNVIKNFESSNVFIELAGSAGLLGIGACGLFAFLFYRRFKNAWDHLLCSQKQWALSWFLSSLVMVVVLQCNQGFFRTYVWVHLGLAWAYFESNKLRLSDLEPMPSVKKF